MQKEISEWLEELWFKAWSVTPPQTENTLLQITNEFLRFHRHVFTKLPACLHSASFPPFWKLILTFGINGAITTVAWRLRLVRRTGLHISFPQIPSPLKGETLLRRVRPCGLTVARFMFVEPANGFHENL
ncbi:hypothetical protein [Pedosphaera parvula]|uniref:hypothetical protein n=1 Tax=Pedosphaera parvula TaxID=1032527 RepID=UPI0012376AAE|nr:hypothetical protein [Pedosphaera parvula]